MTADNPSPNKQETPIEPESPGDAQQAVPLPPAPAPTPTSSPSIAHDGVAREMHRGWLSCERVGWWIFNAVVISLATAGALAILLVVPKPWWVTLIILAAWASLTALLVWAAVWFTARQYRAMSWTPHPDRVEFRKGVWFRKIITIPRTRVQHTDVTQGPLQRRFVVATLVVHTAGTAYAKVDFSGLTHADAERLRDWLLARNEPDQPDV